MKQSSIHKEVQRRYTQFANQVLETNEALDVNADGYAPKTGQSAETLAQKLYSATALIDIPEPAINASIGCGNPLAIANLQAGEHVLDLGSGGGLDCFQAAKVVGIQGSVIGVDATPSMITLANQNKAKMGVANVEFRQGTIESLPVASNSIDLIISNCVIDISADKTAVFQEAFRVLKAGGRIAISDTVLMGDIPAALKPNIDQWAGAVITPLISLPTYLQFMVDAGFVNIRVDSLTSYGLESFEALNETSKETLTQNYQWKPLPPNTGLYSALIWAEKPLS